jgi:hypothetical protein
VAIPSYRLTAGEGFRGVNEPFPGGSSGGVGFSVFGAKVFPTPGFSFQTNGGNFPGPSSASTPASGQFSAAGNSVQRFPYSFNQNDCNEVRGFAMVDAGFQNNGTNDGTVIIFYNKITDGTIADGNGLNQSIFAQAYDGTALVAGDKVVISNRGRLNAGGADQGDNVLPPLTDLTSGVGNFGQSFGPYKFDTGLSNVLLLPRSNDLCKGSYSASSIYLYYTAPSNDNGAGPTGVFTRKFDVAKAHTASTGTFGSFYTPTTDASTTTAGGTFSQGQRLDRELNSSASVIDTFQSGSAVIVVIVQDNHLWGASSSDGVQYTNVSGRPAPALIDNNLSNSTIQFTTGLPTGGGLYTSGSAYNSCRKFDNSCDDLHNSVLGFAKADTNGATRLYVRILQ